MRSTAGMPSWRSLRSTFRQISRGLKSCKKTCLGLQKKPCRRLSLADSEDRSRRHLGCLGTELCLVLQVPRFRAKPVAAARTPEAVPLDEYLADLTALLAASVPSRADRLLGLVTYAYTFASHFLFSPGNYYRRTVDNRRSFSSLPQYQLHIISI